ncbi:MAG: hypothetical protein LJE68_09805 [Rhodobacter sp.]|nr:hypothetical protein [Rhodobacter sp.]
MTLAEFAYGTTLLLILLDPVDLAFCHLGLTDGVRRAIRQRIAVRACLFAFGALAVAAIASVVAFALLPVAPGIVRIGLGLVILRAALDMVSGRANAARRALEVEYSSKQDPAMMPLATPMICSPGVLAGGLLVAAGGGFAPAGLGYVLGVLAAAIGALLAMLILARLVRAAIDRAWVNAQSRFLGVVLVVLAIQAIYDGLLALGLTPV